MNLSTEMSARTTRTLRIFGWSGAALLLLAPAIGMQFEGSGVDWSAGDFIFAAVAFGVVGGLLELAARTTSNLAYRVATASAIMCAFLQVWITLAVGIIGSEDNPANWTYLAVPFVAIVGAIVALGDPRALARAMRATAVFQGLVCLVHLIDGIYPAVMIDGFFTMTWLTAGALFARAVQERAERATQS